MDLSSTQGAYFLILHFTYLGVGVRSAYACGPGAGAICAVGWVRMQTSWSARCDSNAASRSALELRHRVAFVLGTWPLSRPLSGHVMTTMTHAPHCDCQLRTLLLR